MKVVLFCGGLGTRLRDYGDNVPKPLVPIGYRPVLWHVMKYYAHYGHKEFILCLGYKADRIKDYFLNYDECISNDFVMTKGGKSVDLVRSDIDDWKITFVDTGMNANIGTRLQRVREYIGDDEYFLANYADGLTDFPLPSIISKAESVDCVGAFLCAPPSQTFHVVAIDEAKRVQSIQYVKDTNILVNCGYFVFNRKIFDHMHPGEELVEAPFQRLIQKGLLYGFPCKYFFAMDTFKEQQELSDMYERGEAPWAVWEPNHQSHSTTQ